MLQSVPALMWILTAAVQSVAQPSEVALNEPAACALGGTPFEADECPPTSGNLPFFYDLYTFRGEEGGTDIVAAYAVPEGNLHREDAPGGISYRMVVSLVLVDVAQRLVSRTDDSVTVRLSRPQRDQLLRTQLEVQAAPSASTHQRVIVSDVTTPGFGQLYQGRFPIPDYSGPRLMLSDVALADPDVEEGWRRGDVTLALLPTGRLREASFYLYYEIYNLPAGNPYSTEITIEPLDGDAGGRGREAQAQEVRTRFAGESAAGADATTPELRRVESPLPRGRYRLTITIRDEASGETAQRSRLFQIGD